MIETAKTEKLWDMIKSIRIAMLTSEDGPHLRSRPMAASQTSFDGTLWFFTRVDSHKVDEISHDGRVNVSYADADSQNYVSLSGQASLVRAPDQIKAHWSEGMRTWFPNGVTDPEIALLKVDVTQAEYWDAPSSTMVYVAGYAKALVTGKSPHPGENEKLQLV
jgi:prepilin-type processing-associated H-X9-DG protein